MTLDLQLGLLAVASFTAAFLSACFSVGGVSLQIAATSWIMPLPSAIALQSVLSFGSLFSRTHAFWAEIDWPIVRAFTLGSLAGVAGGLWLFTRLPTGVLAVLLGVLLLALTWWPAVTMGISTGASFFGVGVAHAVVGTLFGLGAILQPALLRTSLTRTAIVGTFATCIICLEVLRTLGYSASGFSYAQWWPHILVASVTGLAGTYLGKHVPPPVSDKAFRAAMRIFVTWLGLRFVVKGLFPTGSPA